jgi:hypothetical protein
MEENISRVLMLASSYGLLMTPNPPAEITHIPISLTPAEFQKRKFENLVRKTQVHNELMIKVSQNTQYLYDVLENICLVDEFTRRLLEVSRNQKKKGFKQSIQLGLTRNDFMFDESEGKFFQVEFNTIAASFVCIGSKIAEFHSHVDRIFGIGKKVVANNPLDGFVNAFQLAFQLYGSRGVVLFVVIKDEKNLFDQTGIELELWKR